MPQTKLLYIGMPKRAILPRFSPSLVPHRRATVEISTSRYGITGPNDPAAKVVDWKSFATCLYACLDSC